MANRRTSSRQALKDMFESGLDITFFIGNINRVHSLNIAIGIITKEKAEKPVREKRQPKVIKEKPKKYQWAPKPQPKKHIYNQNITFNPDGTVSLGFTHEWDYK